MEVRLRIAAAVALALLTLTAVPGAASPRRPATDCLASWTSVTCQDEDGACDRLAGPGCLVATTVCFHNGPGDESCPHPPIDAVGVQRPLLKGGRAAVAHAVIDTLVELGGTEERRYVAFADEPAPRCATFEVLVPRKRERTGHVVLSTRTKAGRSYDADRTKFVCTPPDPDSDNAPPLSSGCRSSMDAEECAAHDGVFSEAEGVLQQPHCFCRTDDFGEPCSAPRHCQGLCLAPSIDATEGTCSEHATAFGCFAWFIAEGQVFSGCRD